jgi:acyl-CoA reductase-like NAD-dependent aldehyde dehydrogenase
MRLPSPGVALVLLAVAGCGGGDGSFTEDYNRAVQPIAKLGGNPGTRPAHYERLAMRARETKRNLAHLTAPDGAGDELDALRTELGRVADGFDDVARAARERDASRQLAATRELRSDIRAYERAEKALKRAVEG